METNNITYKKCSFELAKLLKEHNYGYDVDFWYDADGNIMLVESEYKAPLLVHVKSWLHDKKHLDVTVTSRSVGNGNSSRYYYVIDDVNCPQTKDLLASCFTAVALTNVNVLHPLHKCTRQSLPRFYTLIN